jgi:hypothetical protein
VVAIRDRAVSTGTTVGTFTLPAHQTGDLLILAQSAHRGGSATPSGWTLVHDVMAATGTVSRALKVWAKIAASNAETVTVASSGFRASAVGLSIRDHAVTTLTDIVIGSTLADTLTEVDYAALSGLSTGAEYVVVAGFTGRGGTGYYPTAAPSGYANFTGVATGTGSTDTSTITSDRVLSGATSVDPPSQSVTASNHVDWTLAIPGAAASTAYPAAGAVTALSSALGSITRQTTAAGAVVALSAAAGAITVQSAGIVLAGAVEAVSAASGSITKATTVAGAVVAVSSVSGTPGTVTALSGAAVATSAAAGSLRLRRPLAGGVSAYSAAMGALKMVQAPTLPPTVLLRPEATLTVAGKVLAAVSGDAVLDAARVPYAAASVEVAVTNPDTVEAIDPRQGVRAVLTASNAGVSSRSFNLGVRERTIDHAAKTMKLELASDEAMLIDYAPITQDMGAFAVQSSARAVCNYVLGKVIPGASLSAGSADADATTLADATNMVTDPRFATGAAGGLGQGNVTILTDNTWLGTENVAGIHMYNPTNVDGYVEWKSQEMAFGMAVGRTYTWSATGSVRSTMGGSEGGLARRLVAVALVNGGYQNIGYSPQVPLTVNASTRVETTFTVPQGTTQVWIRAFHGHTQGTITWRAFRLSETHDTPGSHNWDYFDGSRTATDQYAYAWTGTADASTSRRVALIDRAPELLIWEPGVSAWDFLSPIVTIAGLRLWCDENRVWRLTDPAEYTVPGVLSVTGFNAPEGSDTITRSDPEVYCTGIVVKYTWRDTNGEQREAIDSAGVAGSVLVWEFNRPYPGPGAAAAMLNRRAGAGRVQEVTALIDYAATPGMEARITLPSTADQQGLLTSVSWSLTDGLMQVGTKGLLDLVKGSINALTGTIDQLTGTIDQL